MKNVPVYFISCVILFNFAGTAFTQQSINPRLGVSFGEMFIVEGIFVDKPNTYFDQNVIAEPYLFQVRAVNGKPLPGAVVMEYRMDGDQVVKMGKVYTFSAYESIYDFGTPHGWTETAGQFDYSIHHRIYLKRK